MNLNTPSSHSFVLPRLNFLIIFSTSFPPSSTGVQGMGAVVSSSDIVSATPSPQGETTPHSFPVPHMGAVPHELLSGSPSQTAVLHKVLQRGSLPLHAVLQEQTPVFHTGSIPAIKHAPAWAPLSTHASKRLFQHGLPTESQPLSGIHLSSKGCRWTSAPPWPSMGRRSTAASAWFAPWTEGNLSSGTWTSSCPLLLHGPWCLQSCFSHVFSLLSPAATALLQYLLPLLKQVIPEALPLSLMGLALPLLDKGKLLAVFTETTPVAPSVPHKTSAMQTQCVHFFFHLKAHPYLN